MPSAHEYIEELKRRRIELQSRILAHRTQLSDPSDYLLADSEDEDSDRQAPARLAQIQQLAKQAVGSEELPTADVVFALAAQGRLTSAGPGMVQGD